MRDRNGILSPLPAGCGGERSSGDGNRKMYSSIVNCSNILSRRFAVYAQKLDKLALRVTVALKIFDYFDLSQRCSISYAGVI